LTYKKYICQYDFVRSVGFLTLAKGIRIMNGELKQLSLVIEEIKQCVIAIDSARNTYNAKLDTLFTSIQEAKDIIECMYCSEDDSEEKSEND
jgi:hypothetical protein